MKYNHKENSLKYNQEIDEYNAHIGFEFEKYGLTYFGNDYPTQPENSNNPYIPLPFPFPPNDFPCSKITDSDFPNLKFCDNCDSYSEMEAIDILEQNFADWKIKLSRLPLNQMHIDIELDKAEDIIRENKHEFFRPSLLIARQFIENYPINAKRQKLYHSKEILKKLINSEEKDIDKKKLYALYLDKVCALIDPNYRGVTRISKAKVKKTKVNYLPTKLTDLQRGKMFDLLVSNGFIPEKDKDGFIWAFGGVNDNYTSYSTEWLKRDNLAVYLVDCLCFDRNVKIQDSYLNRAGKIFGIKNPRQTKKGYENNKNGTPDGYELIDTIISESQK
jgi:hypothetical protein